jgi:hypothetical protein
MTIETLLSELMVQSITIANASSLDSYGKHSYAAPTTVTNCRVQTGAHKVTDVDGQEIVASGKVYIASSPTVTPSSKITLPDGSVPRVLVVDRFSDERGSHHTCIHYGV